MMNRRGFMLAMTTGLVALSLVVGSVIADELLGVITKVDVDGKVLTVVQKDSDKEIKVKVTDKTETVSRKGTQKIDLEKLEKRLEKAQNGGARGIEAKITHEKGVASKIQYTFKKKAQ
jgi:LytS/YehU family sensor histidine kinase